MLDLPGVVVPEPVGELDLLERVLQQLVLVVLPPRAGQLMLIEDPELHGASCTESILDPARDSVEKLLSFKRLFDSDRQERRRASSKRAAKADRKSLKAKENSDSSGATRERILDAADRLFGERGYQATSMRALTEAAGVNLAAVHYHFGSKADLLRASLLRHLEPINRERLRRLDLLEAGSDAPDVRDLFDALLRPAFEFTHASDESRAVIQGMMGLLHGSSPEVEPGLIAEVFAEVMLRFRAAMLRAVPELDEREVQRRLGFAIGSMFSVMTTRLPYSASDSTTETLEDLIRFVEAGFLAGVKT